MQTAHFGRILGSAISIVLALSFLTILPGTPDSIGPEEAFGAHNLPGNNVALPAAPAVLVFRGGNAAFNGTHWGGRSGYDAVCEGSIRRALGLLTTLGAPAAVPGGQQIMNGMTVVGFANAAGTYRAYNLDVVSFATAWAALGTVANDKLYVCTHGGRANRKPFNKGGLIQLDNGMAYDGFASAALPNGTNANGPNGAYAVLGNPMAAVTVDLHNCFSTNDPDGGAALMESVSTSLSTGRANVAINHGHNPQSTSNIALEYDDGPAPGAPTPQELTNAMTQIANGVFSDPGAGRLAPIFNESFPDMHSKIQSEINIAVPQVGGQNVIDAHLGWGDTGNGMDPPDEAVASACQTADFPVPCKKLLIKNKVPDDESKNLLKVIMKDPGIAPGAAGSSEDPTCSGLHGGGGALIVSSTATGHEHATPLGPCTNWSVIGGGNGYKYKDPENDDSTCKIVIIKQGLVKAVCKGSGPTDLDYDITGASEAPVDVIVATGIFDQRRYCAQLGGTVTKPGTDGKKFLAKNSAAPSQCASPSGAFVDGYSPIL